MRRFCFSLLLLFLAAPLSAADLDWPKITSQTKPWTRWWWLGNIGTEWDFTVQMEKYAAAGLGGLEITPIYGVRGEEKRFTPYLSPEWMQKLDHVLREGKRLDLGIDMATGTGWPFGGPWVDDKDAAKYVAHATFTVKGGERLAEPVKYIQRPIVRVAGSRRVAISDLKQPISSNADLQDLALDQVRFEVPLPLVTLMAFSGDAAPVDLTGKVDAGGKLDWVAPAGSDWTLHALFVGRHGKMVERSAPGGEGFAIDHFSSTALAHYLGAFDRAYAKHPVSGLRAYFNDSYEVDDAQGESNWTDKFLEEFQKRRGYDLRTQLPALYGAETNETASRVLSDYRETISDLLLDEFTIPWQAWAKEHNAVIRNQPHGSPANILDLYAASDIPEQEGSDVLSIKLASSAAHVKGKPLASAESATWLNEHFLSTLAELRASVDTYFLGGINHNCYHGTVFSPPDEAWPGFQFYASVELNPANPLWQDFSAVNAYVARAQSFLQGGKPDEDVLVYYNIHDRWAQRGTGAMPHFHGRPGETGAREIGSALMTAGLGFDYFSDRMVVTARTAGRLIKMEGAQYRAIVVPETKYMPLATLQQLVALADYGATVIVHRHLPESAPGFNPPTAEFKALLERLQKEASTRDGIMTIAIGDGQFLIGPDLPALFAQGQLRGETLSSEGLKFVRRSNPQGKYYFIVNRGTQPVDGWVTFQAEGKAAGIFDPMSGRLGVTSFRSTPAKLSEVYLQLAPGESRIVQFYTGAIPDTPVWRNWQPVAAARPVDGTWAISFVDGGPTLPAAVQTTELKSWTEFEGDAVKVFSGTALYGFSFLRPETPVSALLLDLGRVAESARVSLNGREIAVLNQPPYRVVIPADALQAQNVMEIYVTNLAANRIADLDRKNPGWKKFYNTNMPARRRENAGPDGLFSAAKWTPRESGLLGPVTLTPLSLLKP